MAFNSSSQVSYLVLDSLSNGSKYGLEIIEYISKKTNGGYILKKPTLYSCLTRMEKKGLVSSSYWGESELGGKRHYYTITNEGRRELETLAVEYQNVTYAQPTTSYAEVTEAPVATSVTPTETVSTTENKPVFLQQDNLFDMVKPAPKQEEAKTEESSNIVENQIDIFSFQESLPKETQPTTEEQTQSSSAEEEKIKYYQNILEQTPQDDGKLLDASEKLTAYQEEQNRRLYDSSHDINKYRKRKSFSENQIEMAMVYDNAEDREIQKSRIEQLKQAMLSSRQNAVQPAPQEEIKPTYTQPAQISQPKEDINIEPAQDDAVFITDRMHPSEVPIQKKISPTNIEVSIYDDNLPAPKRNTNLEPTYKDMMAKLFERKKEKSKPEVSTPITPITIDEEAKVENFADYNSLKKYYAGHNIEFKEYTKTKIQHQHNTNFLNLINSVVLLCLSGIGCAILFGIISATGLLQSSSNFLFYTLPIIFAAYTIFTFIMYKLYPSKKPALSYNSIVIWAVTILAIIIVLIINILCGMLIESMLTYITSLCVPAYGIILGLPVNHYIKKFLYKKYGK